MHPCADPLQHIQRWLDRGADGVKLIETKPTVWKETGADLSDAAFDPLFAFLEESQTPVLWHVGDPATFWKQEEAPDFAFQNGWFYGDGGFPELAALYGVAETVLERHPKLRATFAHLYFCGDDRRTWSACSTGMKTYAWTSRPAWRCTTTSSRTGRDGATSSCGGRTESSWGRTRTGATPSRARRRWRSRWARSWAGAVDQWGHRGQGLDLPQAVVQKIVRENFRAFAGAQPKPVAAD